MKTLVQLYEAETKEAPLNSLQDYYNALIETEDDTENKDETTIDKKEVI